MKATSERERDGPEAAARQAAAPAPAPPVQQLLALQASAGNQAVTRMLSRELDTESDLGFDLAGAMKGAWKAYLDPKRSHFIQKTQAVLGIPIEAWLDGEAKTAAQRENFVRNLAQWQGQNSLAVTGILDPDTIKAIKKETGGEWGKEQSEQDKESMEAVGEMGDAERDNADDAQRSAIVAAALSQVGKVNAANRGDGQKYGGERIVEYYKAAVPGYTADWDTDLKKANIFLGQTIGEDGKATPPTASLGGPWSWCGIFAIWAVKTVTGVGKWDQEPTDYALVDGKVENAKPGDIIKKRGALNHHCVVVKIDGENVTTVNGNGVAQAVWVNTEPLKNYDYYYDVMSQVPLTTKIEQWRAFYENHGVKDPNKMSMVKKYSKGLPKGTK